MATAIKADKRTTTRKKKTTSAKKKVAAKTKLIMTENKVCENTEKTVITETLENEKNSINKKATKTSKKVDTKKTTRKTPSKTVKKPVNAKKQTEFKVRARQTIKNEVVKQMKELGIYRVEYKNQINIYVGMLHQYEFLEKEFEKMGYTVAEEYTNKAGATNLRKTPLLTVLEKLRMDIASYSTLLGLNPKAMESITPEKKQSSKLVEMLNGIK